MRRKIFLIIYYGVAQYLPNSYTPIIGKVCNRFRIYCVKRIFKKCGNIRTINRKVNFEGGRNIEIGDDSGIGARTSIPNDTKIGNNVVIARDVFILNRNPNYENINIPINDQGKKQSRQTVIEDDCWIGLRTIITPGRLIRKGTIIAMGTVLTKDFPEYSIVGGNPSKLIRSRK